MHTPPGQSSCSVQSPVLVVVVVVVEVVVEEVELVVLVVVVPPVPPLPPLSSTTEVPPHAAMSSVAATAFHRMFFMSPSKTRLAGWAES
jgi:hypothetical protein